MDGEISPDEVAERVRDGGVRIVDIRSHAAFERGHIPGSENIPFQELPDRVDSLEDSDHIVTVCPHGEASVQAARLIESYEGIADATVESMAGGLDAWEDELEAENDDGDEEAVAEGEQPDAPF